jgi:hypothetical protein
MMGTRSIEVSSWDKSIQELGVSKDIADRLRSRHMRRLLEEHEYVLPSYGRRGLEKDREERARETKE